MKIRGKNIAVVGMGRSGVSASKLALSLGAKVLCIDQNPAATKVAGCQHLYGTNASNALTEQDLIILSPGVPPDQTFLQPAQHANVPFAGELGFAASCITIPIIAVTGTNGKSSTVWYLYQFLQQAGYKPFLGGNFGLALSELALDPMPYDIAVVEVSSYQMELPYQFHPKAAVILNLTPDHLARHKTMTTYAQMKGRIFAQQEATDISIAPWDTPEIHPKGKGQQLWLGHFPGVKHQDNQLCFSGTPDDGDISLDNLQLLGAHNIENIAAAALMLIAIGIPRKQLIPSQLQALEHRLQTVHINDQIRWVNDSKATNIEAAIAGIQGAPSPQIVLLGGQGKQGANYQQLLPSLSKQAKTVICFGSSGPSIADSLSSLPSVHLVSSMKEATSLAAQLAIQGDTILLSPGCASFDEFQNFTHRGQVFTTWARGEDV